LFVEEKGGGYGNALAGCGIFEVDEPARDADRVETAHHVAAPLKAESFTDSKVSFTPQVLRSQAGQKVDVLGRQYGQAAFAPLATVDTATDGAWTYTASPTIQTAYEAKWLTATSRTVAVKVQPQLTLTKVSVSGVSSGTFSVKATANRSFAGKFVLVQRLAASGATQLKKVVLDSGSSATFTIRAQPAHSRLRAVMPTSQTQPGYVATQSAVLTIHR
jgi:hypothetical protein